MTTEPTKRVEVGFHHTSGGDSHLPQSDRGFFDDYTVAVAAMTPAEAERLGFEAMYAEMARDHPNFPNSAIDDLAAEVWVDDVQLTYDEDSWKSPFAQQ